MPYIPKEEREQYTNLILTLRNIIEIPNKGHLEYLIFLLMKKYMSTRDNKYKHLHDTVYSSIHAGEEFKRRYLDKREDEAKKTNGEIEEV